MSTSRLYPFLRSIVLFFFLAFICLFLLIAGMSTSAVSGDFHEHTYFLPDSFLLNLLLSGSALLGLYYLWRCLSNRKLPIEPRIHSQKLGSIGLLCIFSFSLLWAYFTQPLLISDQASIQESASQLSYGDLTPLLPGGYCARYPHQLGTVLLCIPWQLIFGRDNTLSYFLLNAVFCTLCYRELMLLIQTASEKNCSIFCMPFLGLLFYPLLLYSTFVYPTLPSFYFSLLSFRQMALYFQTARRQNVFFSVLSMGFAVLLKPNSLIFLIALLLVCLFALPPRRSLPILVFLILCALAGNLGPKLLTERLYHIDMPDGISPYSYFAMGMQEGERAPGWYNGYINTNYVQSQYDAEVQKGNALVQIHARLEQFKGSPSLAIRFYLRKIASQWNNPTFEGFWLHQVRGSSIDLPLWLSNLSPVTGVHPFSRILNLLQFVILIGSLLFGLLVLPTASPVLLLLPLTFVGGVLFHLIWEAKCQYALPYFTLLLPCALLGVRAFFLSVHRKELPRVCLKAGVLALALSIALTFALLPHINVLRGDGEAYQQYLENQRHLPVLQAPRH